tara:strand:- start:7854 stop:8927 length:1074 start_codon:yes stop_codon:yes gene_type:complete
MPRKKVKKLSDVAEENSEEENEGTGEEPAHSPTDNKDREGEGDSDKKDTVEIPIGNFVKRLKKIDTRKIRENPWMISTVVLGLAFVAVLLFSGGGGVTGNVISEGDAGQNLVDFINSQGAGQAEFISAERDGNLYQVVVNYNGQDVPVFVTLDGRYLVTDVVPLDADLLGNPGTGNSGGEPVEIEIGDAPVKGDANAPVTIVEFSDYQCPFCAKFYTETFGLLEKNYIDTGKVKLVFMDFPLDFHPEAQPAAEAARCVREQKGDEGYYEMHDKLFENQGLLSEENYKKWARELGVDGAEFDSCLDSGKFVADVQADLTYGQQLGVSGTPGFFVNGQLVSGAQPYSVFEQLIEAGLSA